MSAERWDITGTDQRLLDQYRDSPLLKALIKALVDSPIADLRGAFESLYGRLAIATSEGVQLDKIGTIVGAPRPNALTGDTSLPMADEDYRLFLRAIIFQNTNGSSVLELERFGELLLGIPVSVLDALGTVDLQFFGPLTSAQQAILLDTFKVAAGVRARYFTQSGGPGGFGFDGGPNTGFDDTSGAGFAQIFEGQ